MRFMKAQSINVAKKVSILFVVLALIISLFLSWKILFTEEKDVAANIQSQNNQDYNLPTICAYAFTFGVYWSYGLIRKIGSI